MLSDLLGVELTRDTVRRITEQAGGALLTAETLEATALRKSMACPPVQVVDRLQQVSVDGVMVPLVGGTYEEVKLAAVGRVEPAADGPRAGALSYFARLGNADEFIAGAGIEFFRRGTERAREVVAVNDGAEWIQRVLDEYCPNALRIIDWTHAAGYVREAGQSLFGLGTADARSWTDAHLGLLWAGRVEALVAELARLEDDSERLKPVREARRYLEKRAPMLRFAQFREAGYPVGSGIAESGNQVVVQARLSGAGKHWAGPNVNPMLSLRCAAANDRWAERWACAEAGLRRPGRRGPVRAVVPGLPPRECAPPPVPGSRHTKAFENGKPTAAHPWNRLRPARHAKS